jgi:molybdate transport system regulatory protein
MATQTKAPLTPAKAAARMRPRLKLWLETDDGRIVFSDYRVQLLEQVAASGSLAEAAGAMGLSYRRAWGKIRELETNLGAKLVQSVVGGQGGGSTRLTPFAEALIVRFNRFRDAVVEDAERDFASEFEKD